MKIIGILGDIGSGKSYAAKNFSYPVFNADEIVKKIYKKNHICFLKLKKIFPKFISKFPISKSELLRIILSKKKNIKIIGNIVHPLVRVELKKFIKANKRKKFVVLDIPLLMENKINYNNLELIFIDANRKKILKKLKRRPGFNRKLYKIMRDNQLSLNIKKRKSKFVIYNTFIKKDFKKKIINIKKKLSNG